ncbi:MAG: DUF1638 domain-containing protein [Pseudomonadales bacterium]|nr:DUF1638 domain-containing protein [Pseudomonadales bacterium]
MVEQSLIIACGALAREIQQVKVANDWKHVDLVCLDASLHHRPQEITGRLAEKLGAIGARYEKVFIAYADCGTNGAIDRLIEDLPNVVRLPGPHCFSTFAGSHRFDSLMEEEPGTFWLTDFLTRHFQTMVVKSLKLDSHPQLKELYFANYRRLTYVSQNQGEGLLSTAEEAANYLGLEFRHIHVGMDELEQPLRWCVL